MYLSTGTVTDCLKQASVTPLLKKPNLDVSGLVHFRPISNLIFISKYLESVVLTYIIFWILIHYMIPFSQDSENYTVPNLLYWKLLMIYNTNELLLWSF